MEKRVILAFALSIIVFVVWNYLYNPTPTPTTPPPAETATGEAGFEARRRAAPIGTAERPAPRSDSADIQAQTQLEPEDRKIIVETDLFTAVFTENGGRLLSFTLMKYRSASAKDSPPQELVNTQENGDLPLGTFFLYGSVPGLSNAHFAADVPDGETRVRFDSASNRARLTFTHKTPEGFEMVKTYTFSRDSYLIDLKVTLLNLTDRTIEDNLVLGLVSEPFMKKKRYSFAGLGVLADEQLLQIKVDEIEEKLTELSNRKYSLIWAGYEDQYFLMAAMPLEKERTRIEAERYLGQGIKTNIISPNVPLDPQTSETFKYTLFFGPKDYKLMKSLNNGLERSIFFGWFDILSKPLLFSMVWLQQYVKNYGLTIIILTFIIKLIFWPLTAKSHRSMKEMQKIQPRIKKLREKYKDDRQAMNREMMQMYRTFKINPMGGCLPMIIQIPVFISFYRLLDYSLELRHAPFILWIKDLSAPDRLFHFNIAVPFLQEPTGIPVLTLLMGATMFLQQKMMPTGGDPTQAKVMMFMPLFFTVIFVNFPAGLVLYWLVNNVLTIGQQFYTNKRTS